MDFGTVINILFFVLIFGGAAKRAVAAAKKAKADRRGIPVVAVEGAFANSSDPNSSFRRIMDQLEKVEALQPKVMILKVNSPGSTVGAAHEVYSRINELRAKGIKVVALMQDIAASGGVYVSMASDRVVAGPGTITGSIGVILQGYDYSELLPQLKLKIRVIKSGAMKDILSPARSMTEAETAVLHDMVMDDWQQFCEVVATGRNMHIDRVRSFSDGRVFNGRQALELGLVDEVGGLSEALKAAGRLVGIPEEDCKPVIFEKRADFGLSLRKLLPGSRLDDRLTALVPDATLRGALYLLKW
jgi:protease-4